LGQTETISGTEALGVLGPALDDLHERVATPTTARRAWMQAWIDVYGAQWEPWLLVVGDTHRAAAVAPLARRRVAGCVQVVGLGGQGSDHTPVVSESDAAGEELARLLQRELADLRRPWSLFLPQLDVGHPMLAELNRLYPHGQVTEGPGRPRLVIADRATPRGVSRNTAGSAARHRNLIARHGRTLDLTWHHDPDEVLGLLDELLAVHRRRDEQLGRVSTLDDPTVEAHYRQVIDRHRDHLELLVVRIDREIAAYDLCLRSGTELYVYDNRLNPSFAAYSPGLLANVETVRRAIEDPAIEVLDWGGGVQPFKLSCANEVRQTAGFAAWSSTALRSALGARRWWRTDRGARAVRT
jgi:CelD/BcsL family acetyltransferase involved in cellulose biosynthesis